MQHTKLKKCLPLHCRKIKEIFNTEEIQYGKSLGYYSFVFMIAMNHIPQEFELGIIFLR